MTMISRLKLTSGAVFALSALFSTVGAAQAALPTCSPKIEGPIAITAASKPYEAPSNPYAGTTPPAGEMEEEFFVSCTVSGGAYKTLIHVTLPTDPAKQSGIVMAEPWHRGDFWTIYDKARKYITRAGHVSVVIVADPYILDSFMKKANPARYAGLTLPGDGASKTQTPANLETEMQVLGQVGAFIKKGGIPGVKARKVLLGGMSQTGGITRSYIQFEHDTPGVKSVYDGYFPQQAGRDPVMDLDVPVVEIEGEREIVGAFEGGGDHLRYRRPDGANYRLYEAPGSPHIGTRMATQISGPQPTNRIEPGVPECVGHTWTDYPTDMLFAAALDNLVQWVDKGIAPPMVPRMDTSPDGSIINRDQFGNALGGFRVTYLDVPVATFHATWGHYVTTSTGPSDAMAQKCDQIGWTNPLPAETLKRLYPTHADYVAKVDRSIADLESRRMLLPEDGVALHDEAVKSKFPN